MLSYLINKIAKQSFLVGAYMAETMKVETMKRAGVACKYDGNNSDEIKELLGEQFMKIAVDTKEILMQFVGTEVMLKPGDYILKVNNTTEYAPIDAELFESEFNVISNDWVCRVKKEKAELDENLDKLAAFINKNRESLDDAVLDLMETQADIMAAYSNVLSIRVKLELSRRRDEEARSEWDKNETVQAPVEPEGEINNEK